MHPKKPAHYAHKCYECLSSDRVWRRRYFASWLALGLLVVVAFILIAGPAAIWMQGLTFALIFGQTLRPIFAARSLGTQ